MLLLLSRRFERSYCFVVLLMTNLVTSMPIAPPKRTLEETSGFAEVPKILEIQLPVRIASKEDLVAWAKYVMGLMASKINITLTTVKDPPLENSENTRNNLKNSNVAFQPVKDQQTSNINVPKRMPMHTAMRHLFSGKPNGNFPGARIIDMTTRRPFESNENPNIPGPVRLEEINRASEVPISGKIKENTPFFMPRYSNLDARSNLEAKENEIPRNSSRVVLTPTPSGMYLPLPARTNEPSNLRTEAYVTRYYFDGVERNISRNLGVVPSEVPVNNRNVLPVNRDVEIVPAVMVKQSTPSANLSNVIRPILTLPFEAVITITREDPVETTTARNEKDNYYVVPTRYPPDEFPPYFEKNYTLTNESGQINVVFDDVGLDFDDRTKEKFEDEVDERRKKKKNRKNKDTKKDGTKEQSTRKRQLSALGELLRMLGVLRKSTNSTAEINAAPPVLKILRGTNPQRVQLSEDIEPPPNRGRRNETSQAQELDDDYDDDDDEDGEGEGGSIQALIDLLPLVAPILEDLSDPNSETDIAELLSAAVPLLEGLSQGGEEGGADLPSILVPVLLRVSSGKDGQGSDASAILGPLIKLIAPLIGPIIGPLAGPLSRQSSGGPGTMDGGSSGTFIEGFITPLSKPTGPGKMSPFSNIVAGVVSSLSKELKTGKHGIDISTLVGGVVSGVVAGASAGLSGHKKDSEVAPTSQGGYGGYGQGGVPAHSVNPFQLIGSSLKEIVTVGLKLLSSLLNASTGIVGASSGDGHRQQYGPPPPNTYGAPSGLTAPTNTPFRQTTRAPKKPGRQ